VILVAAVVETDALVWGQLVPCLILRATAPVTGDRDSGPRTCAINGLGREGVAVEGSSPNPGSVTASAGPSAFFAAVRGHHRPHANPEPRPHPSGPSRSGGDPLLDHGTPRPHVSEVSSDEEDAFSLYRLASAQR
jgi:hypothetical protein